MKIKLLEKVMEQFSFEKSKSKLLIRNKQVMFKNNIISDPDFLIDTDEEVKLYTKKEYVSRGAYKLIDAIESFSLQNEIENKIALDIGSSSGGFTEVLLEFGAKKVYALDSGTNQLDYSLRINKKVISMEKTNLKIIKKNFFNEEIEFVTCDVSFISSKEVFKVLNFLKPMTKFILLIKPQFEANSDEISPGGIADKNLHQAIIEKVKHFSENNFIFKGVKECKIKGKKSHNIEYISLFERK